MDHGGYRRADPLDLEFQMLQTHSADDEGPLGHIGDPRGRDRDGRHGFHPRAQGPKTFINASLVRVDRGPRVSPGDIEVRPPPVPPSSIGSVANSTRADLALLITRPA